MATLREEEHSVKLLTTWYSPYGMRVLIGLEELGINYECVEEDLEKKSAVLLQMNPVHKKVPVLIHDGRPVTESLVILQYIEEIWASSNTSFLPTDPYDRAVARFWVDFVDKKVCDPGVQILFNKGEDQEAAKVEFLHNLQILEEELNGKDYFGGDKFGVVDITFAPFISLFHSFEILGRFQISLEEKFPYIEAWKKRCLEREIVKRALPSPEKVLDVTTLIRKKRLGGESL